MTFLAASAAGFLAIVGAMAHAGVVYAEGVQCAGVNGCKGTGECGGVGHDCAGKNACKGMGWVTKATEADCLADKGTVVPKVAAPAAAPVAPAQ